MLKIILFIVYSNELRIDTFRIPCFSAPGTALRERAFDTSIRGGNARLISFGDWRKYGEIWAKSGRSAAAGRARGIALPSPRSRMMQPPAAILGDRRPLRLPGDAQSPSPASREEGPSPLRDPPPRAGEGMGGGWVGEGRRPPHRPVPCSRRVSRSHPVSRSRKGPLTPALSPLLPSPASGGGSGWGQAGRGSVSRLRPVHSTGHRAASPNPRPFPVNTHPET